MYQSKPTNNGAAAFQPSFRSSMPRLRWQLSWSQQLELTTIFVPTNDAPSTLNSSLMEDVSADVRDITSRFYKRLFNHFVTGTFATTAWMMIPTDANVSETQLNLPTHAGNVQYLEIQDTVTIYGFSTILQRNIFSEYGIVHVVDKPLTLYEP
jgi:uncharacterized surface protein with fasciclin (FAS1) repeats